MCDVIFLLIWPWSLASVELEHPLSNMFEMVVVSNICAVFHSFMHPFHSLPLAQYFGIIPLLISIGLLLL